MFDNSCKDEPSPPRSLGKAPSAADFGVDVERRLMLLGSVSALFLGACSRATTHPVGVSPARVEAPASDFLRLSKTLTGHADLDAITAQRLLEAFALAEPAVRANIDALAALVSDGLSTSDALAAAAAKELRATALAVVSAWYTGTVGKGTQAVTVSYRDALMQLPTADALAPPTYVLGGPAWWTATPPDVGLPARAPSAAAPAQAPAPAPAPAPAAGGSR